MAEHIKGRAGTPLTTKVLTEKRVHRGFVAFGQVHRQRFRNSTYFFPPVAQQAGKFDEHTRQPPGLALGQKVVLEPQRVRQFSGYPVSGRQRCGHLFRMANGYDDFQRESRLTGRFEPEVGQRRDPWFLEDEWTPARASLEKRANFSDVRFLVVIVECKVGLKAERGVVPGGSVSKEELLVQPQSFEWLPMTLGVSFVGTQQYVGQRRAAQRQHAGQGRGSRPAHAEDKNGLLFKHVCQSIELPELHSTRKPPRRSTPPVGWRS